MKKVWAVFLLVWPYLLLPFLFVFQKDVETGVLLYCGLTPVVYIGNIICACRNRNIKSLTFWDMLLKLFHIPNYIMIFLLGAMLTGQLIVGSPFGLVLVPFLIVIDCMLMATTSAYGICALVRAGKTKAVTPAYMVLHIILHLVFVWDVISAIAVFAKIRKASHPQAECPAL